MRTWGGRRKPAWILNPSIRPTRPQVCRYAAPARARADTRPPVSVRVHTSAQTGFGGGRVDGRPFPQQHQRLAPSTPGGRGVDAVDGGGDRTGRANVDTSARSGRDQPAGRPGATASSCFARERVTAASHRPRSLQAPNTSIRGPVRGPQRRHRALPVGVTGGGA